jgi:carbonic anhydrase/acetyltransferase-like protein (isoleucine patch superfamily)
MAVMGVPGKIVRPVKPDEMKYMKWLTEHYVELAEKYVVGKFRVRIQRGDAEVIAELRGENSK